MGFVCGECGGGDVTTRYTGNLIIHICSQCGRNTEYRMGYPAKRKENDEPWEHRVEMTPENVENGVYYFTTPNGRLEIDLKRIRDRKCELVGQRNQQYEQWQALADAYVRLRKILGFAGLGNDDPEIFEQTELRATEVMSNYKSLQKFHELVKQSFCNCSKDQCYQAVERALLVVKYDKQKRTKDEIDVK